MGDTSTTLGEACELYQPQTITTSALSDDGPFLVYGANGVIGRYHSFNHEEPQLLITCRGATCGAVNISAPKSWINGNAMVVRPRTDAVDLKYLEHLFRGGIDLSIAITGAAQPQITRQSLAPIKVRFPPLPEQRRIAAILDQADALRAKRREALAQLDSLTQSIFIEMFGDPSSESPKFAKVPLLSLAGDGFQNGAYFPKEAYSDEGIEMVHMSDAFGGIIERGNLKRVSCSQSDLQKYSLTPDDIIIARRSLTYDGAAKPCRVPTAIEPLIFESSFIRVRADKSRLTPLFLFHYLNNDRVRRRFVRPYVTQSTISGINQSNLAQVPIVLPPIELQDQFNARVNSCNSVRERQVESQVELDKLFAALQHRAFRGEL